MWEGGLLTARALIAKGWREGEDVAFCLGYNGEHNTTAWSERRRPCSASSSARSSRSWPASPPKQIADANGGPIHLIGIADNPFVTVELQHADGFRLNAAGVANLAIDNPAVAAIASGDVGEIAIKGRGVATLTAKYAGTRRPSRFSGSVCRTCRSTPGSTARAHRNR